MSKGFISFMLVYRNRECVRITWKVGDSFFSQTKPGLHYMEFSQDTFMQVWALSSADLAKDASHRIGGTMSEFYCDGIVADVEDYL